MVENLVQGPVFKVKILVDPTGAVYVRRTQYVSEP